MRRYTARVWDDRRGVVDFDEWRISSIELLPSVRPGTVPDRLHGTVRTRQGGFTGFVQWDLQECVGSDELTGRTAAGERSLRFDTIRSIERNSSDSSLATLRDDSGMAHIRHSIELSKKQACDPATPGGTETLWKRCIIPRHYASLRGGGDLLRRATRRGNALHLRLDGSPYFMGALVVVESGMLDHSRLLIVDLSVDPAVYRPVAHWRPHVEAAGVPMDVCRPPDGAFPDDLSPYSHAILTGSEASILADTGWIVRTCELTRALDERGVKLLGSCFGHQMLVRALCGRGAVRRTPTPEFGWIELRKEARLDRDPLVDALPDRCHVYTSHFDEVFPLPPGWEKVADSRDCAYAVIRRAGGGVWGLQPHPEIGVDEGLELQESYMETMPENHELLEAAWHGEPRDDEIAGALMRGFLTA